MPQAIKQFFPSGSLRSARNVHRQDLCHRFSVASHYKTFALTVTFEKT